MGLIVCRWTQRWFETGQVACGIHLPLIIETLRLLFVCVCVFKNTKTLHQYIIYIENIRCLYIEPISKASDACRSGMQIYSSRFPSVNVLMSLIQTRYQE